VPSLRGVCRISALSVILLLIPFARIAMAKGPGLDHAVLEGPGIDRPISLTDRYPYLLNRTVLTLAFGSPRDRNIGREQPLSDDLGPRYHLAYYMVAGAPIVVDLYPYAAGGPLALASAGQAIAVGVGHRDHEQRFEVNSGWYDFPPGLISGLRDQGLPSRAAAPGNGLRLPLWLLALVAPILGGQLIREHSRERALLRPQ
jgi:hypothetical protein